MTTQICIVYRYSQPVGQPDEWRRVRLTASSRPTPQAAGPDFTACLLLSKRYKDCVFHVFHQRGRKWASLWGNLRKVQREVNYFTPACHWSKFEDDPRGAGAIKGPWHPMTFTLYDSAPQQDDFNPLWNYGYLYHQIWIINSIAQWVKLRSTDLQVQSLNTSGTFVLIITIYQYFRSWFLKRKIKPFFSNFQV